MSLNGSQPNFARCLAVSRVLHYMYIYGGSCPVTEFCQVQSSLCVHLRTVAQLPRAISSQLRHAWTVGKKLTKQKYILQMFSQYGEFRPTSGWAPLASLRHHSKFQRVSRFGSVSAATSLTWGQPNFARCLAVSWAATLYTPWVKKKGATLTMAITLSILDRFANFFHYCKDQ